MLVLGGGLVGRVIARDLAREKDFYVAVADAVEPFWVVLLPAESGIRSDILPRRDPVPTLGNAASPPSSDGWTAGRFRHS